MCSVYFEEHENSVLKSFRTLTLVCTGSVNLFQTKGANVLENGVIGDVTYLLGSFQNTVCC